MRFNVSEVAEIKDELSNGNTVFEYKNNEFEYQFNRIRYKITSGKLCGECYVSLFDVLYNIDNISE